MMVMLEVVAVMVIRENSLSTLCCCCCCSLVWGSAAIFVDTPYRVHLLIASHRVLCRRSAFVLDWSLSVGSFEKLKKLSSDTASELPISLSHINSLWAFYAALYMHICWCALYSYCDLPSFLPCLLLLFSSTKASKYGTTIYLIISSVTTVWWCPSIPLVNYLPC